MFPLITQTSLNDCGPTCLRMISKYYGKECDSNYLNNLVKPGSDGITLFDLANTAEIIGFKTLCVEVPIKTLTDLAPLPCILFWNFNHFVVLYEINNGQILIADPVIGLTSINYFDFEAQWCSGNKNGIALLLETTPQFYSSC